MNEAYWDRLASTYTDEVHDNLAADRRGVIARWLDEFASLRRTAVDFGCGIGHYLRDLSMRFKHVTALDHSGALLERARATHRELDNIAYRKADLSKPLKEWDRADLGVCMNVLIAPDHKLRTAMVRTIHRALHPGGHLLTLIPSLESSLYTDTRLIDWNMRRGLSHDRALREGLCDEPGVLGHPAAGVVDTGGEPTKHYLAEEAFVMMQDAGFEVLSIEKVEYDWSNEFDHPPRWLREPYPWHWLLVCRKKA